MLHKLPGSLQVLVTLCYAPGPLPHAHFMNLYVGCASLQILFCLHPFASSDSSLIDRKDNT